MSLQWCRLLPYHVIVDVAQCRLIVDVAQCILIVDVAQSMLDCPEEIWGLLARGEWDPKDPHERLLVLGRYISEDFSGVALHPVDLLDASTGRLVAQLIDPNLETICPVNKPHPRLDLIISGSSRSLYAWKPVPQGMSFQPWLTEACNCPMSRHCNVCGQTQPLPMIVPLVLRDVQGAQCPF